MDDYYVPEQVHNIGWSIVFTALFIFGALTVIYTARKTSKGYNESGDSWSSKTIMHAVVGFGISAILLVPGYFFGLLRIVGSLFGSFGVGS